MSATQWHHDAPIDRPLLSAPFIFFTTLAIVGVSLSAKRLFGGLSFTGMNDDYAWGVWKTFNVMTLTALGSSALAVGLLTWVFNQKHLHVIMRASLTSSLLFYGTGMFALAFDVGRPWNFWNIILPSRWNLHSALFEVMLCMTAYAAIFLLYENLPAFLPKKWFDKIKPAYPYMVAAAFLLPAMHQSSLGSLMVIGGPKVHVLWQTQMLPALYLIQAIICGFASIIIILMVACLAWRRPVDLGVLSTVARAMSLVSIGFVIVRYADVIIRGVLGAAFQPTWYALLFHAENFLVLIPALLLLSRKVRNTQRALFLTAIFIALGGLLYRFSPTTFAFRAGSPSIYFPSVAELLMCLGYIGLAVALFIAASKYFSILPDQLHD